MVVFVEASVLEDPALARDPRFQSVRDRLQTFRDGTDDLQVMIIFAYFEIYIYNKNYNLCVYYTTFRNIALK